MTTTPHLRQQRQQAVDEQVRHALQRCRCAEPADWIADLQALADMPDASWVMESLLQTRELFEAELGDVRRYLIDQVKNDAFVTARQALPTTLTVDVSRLDGCQRELLLRQALSQGWMGQPDHILPLDDVLYPHWVLMSALSSRTKRVEMTYLQSVMAQMSADDWCRHGQTLFSRALKFNHSPLLDHIRAYLQPEIWHQSLRGANDDWLQKGLLEAWQEGNLASVDWLLAKTEVATPLADWAHYMESLDTLPAATLADQRPNSWGLLDYHLSHQTATTIASIAHADLLACLPETAARMRATQRRNQLNAGAVAPRPSQRRRS